MTICKTCLPVSSQALAPLCVAMVSILQMVHIKGLRAEVCPVNLHAYLTTYANLHCAFGTILGPGVLRECLNNCSFHRSFSYSFCASAGFCDPSPWWLICHGCNDEAKLSLHRSQTHGHRTEEDIDATVTLMTRAHQPEQETRPWKWVCHI
ncbi:hypothetical protein TSTA_030550 [Talaromyces stipitatus ATCC 10500]|uniref:Uncharacterized protein n=1 Tax=Talaromyces stipitatus (strain ATCC 10500 / CBS 375.48 / QM 6759 / NRRL 1006) TaxID=441959 RepID=B8M7R0_TALSN|nr:uncharacterized protein TSTA_030550 [Talaromyces stipitatus ATCC 10500]EED19789.1 hypothetical protein TSTA_030550 [Talaromyces stipitatus ATCC 10500]